MSTFWLILQRRGLVPHLSHCLSGLSSHCNHLNRDYVNRGFTTPALVWRTLEQLTCSSRIVGSQWTLFLCSLKLKCFNLLLQRYDCLSTGMGALACTSFCVYRGQDPWDALMITASATIAALVSPLPSISVQTKTCSIIYTRLTFSPATISESWLLVLEFLKKGLFRALIGLFCLQVINEMFFKPKYWIWQPPEPSNRTPVLYIIFMYYFIFATSPAVYGELCVLLLLREEQSLHFVLESLKCVEHFHIWLSVGQWITNYLSVYMSCCWQLVFCSLV